MSRAVPSIERRPFVSNNKHGIARWGAQSLITTTITITMPHSTRAPSATQAPSYKFPADSKPSLRTSMEKFPDINSLDGQSEHMANGNEFMDSSSPIDRWHARRDNGASWTNGHSTGGGGSARQKSLSDAFKTIRTRKASVSANVHEISDALKAPVSPLLIVRQPPFFQSCPNTTTDW